MEIQPRIISRRRASRSIVDCLPPELFFQVLLKLPDVKTILVCSSVCKTWNSLIKSRDFISTHRNHQTLSLFSPTYNNNDPLLLIKRNYSHPDRVGCSIGFETEDEVQDSFFLTNSISFTNVCCCNGLVCFSGMDTDEIILWNPTIKKSITLPRARRISCPDPDCPDCFWSNATGLGFDPGTNGYKVLTVVESANHGSESRWVEVYSLNSDSWKTVNSTLPELLIIPPACVTFANGSLHFLGIEMLKEKKRRRKAIFAFDLVDGALNQIMLPGTLSVVKHQKHMSIMVYESSIAAVQETMGDYGKYEIWVMREYCVVESWTKMSTIQDKTHFLRGLAFRKNGEILMARKKGGPFVSINNEDRIMVLRRNIGKGIISLDLKRKRAKNLTVGWKEGHGVCITCASSYVESLALLDIDKRHSQSNLEMD